MRINMNKTKEIFSKADEILQKRPELLSISPDQIFDKYQNGPEEMISIRWGIMTRAIMSSLCSYSLKDILDFISKIDSKVSFILQEYIGYVFLAEHNVCLIELLLEAYKRKEHQLVIPYVLPCLAYDKTCHIEDINIITDIINSLDDLTRTQFISSYVDLVIALEKEDDLLNMYKENSSEIFELLVFQLMRVIKLDKAEKWAEILLNTKKDHCIVAGIHALQNTLFYDSSLFEKYFKLLENQYSKTIKYWECMIPVYALYLIKGNNLLCKETIVNHMMLIKEGTISEKRICINEIALRCNEAEEYVKIIDSILTSSFDKDPSILSELDFYFEVMFDKDPIKVLMQLYTMYKKNNYTMSEDVFDSLSQLAKKIRQNQDRVIEFWFDRFVHGDVNQFICSINILQCLSIDCIDRFLSQNIFSCDILLCFLDGVILFCINEKLIVNIIFLMAAHIKDDDLYYQYCVENVYNNYPYALSEMAKNYSENENIHIRLLAQGIIKHHESFMKKQQKGYNEKIFTPPAERQVIFDRHIDEQSKKIFEKANEGSILISLFKTRKMKYGKRIAYIQNNSKGQFQYQVNPYLTNGFSSALPIDFINNPLEYRIKRIDYLNKRG